MLTVVAGRVDGSAERPQLLPLEQLAIELYRGDRRLGRLALVRDLLPGRYSFGITGRGPGGKRLPPGDYALRLTATPVDGGATDEQIVPFTISVACRKPHGDRRLGAGRALTRPGWPRYSRVVVSDGVHA